jgi:hypothetical protein
MSVSLIHRPHTVTRPSKRRAVCDRLDAVRTTMARPPIIVTRCANSSGSKVLNRREVVNAAAAEMEREIGKALEGLQRVQAADAVAASVGA